MSATKALIAKMRALGGAKFEADFFARQLYLAIEEDRIAADPKLHIEYLRDELASAWSGPYDGDIAWERAELKKEIAEEITEALDKDRAKPFKAPGRWYPLDVMGNPMREYASGKWETATWASEEKK